MPEERYDESEIRRIFKLAAVETSQSAQETSGSLTLSELKSIGAEVGISADRIAEAAASLESMPFHRIIEARPKGLFSNDFVFLSQDGILAEIDVSWWRERADFRLKDVDFQLRRQGLRTGAFIVEVEDKVLATAVKPSMLRSLFEIEIGGRLFTFRKLSPWRSAFGLFEDEKQIGRISRVGVFTRRASIELPEEWPAAAQIFTFWLALLIWNREAAAAS